MGLFKKMLVGGLVAGGAIVAFRGTNALTHVRHEVRQARAWADDQVPMDKKFKVLRDDVAALDGEVDKVKTELAREIVETRELTAKTVALRAKVDGDKKDLLARGQAIKDATDKVKFGGREISVDAAKSKLQRDVTAHGHDKAHLATLEATLAHTEQNRDTLQETLTAMVTQKDELLAQIDAAEADYKRLQLEQVKSKYQTDDTKLARIKQRLAELRKQVEIKKERHILEPVGQETAPAATPSVDDILRPVAGKPAAKADAPASGDAE